MKRAIRADLGVGLVLAFVLGCFSSEFAQGLPCDNHDDCGPGLSCVEGLCGGPGTAPVCGNGLSEIDEACDDGNTSNEDACVEVCEGQGCVCADARCGDGYVWEGVEDCDDGNDIDSDDCPNDCLRSTCGNGEVELGEDCDDGNTNAGDYCTPVCTLPQCGDGFLGPDEACDDGNQDNTDACVSCADAVCGDGFVQAEVEACDDGNEDVDDGCTPTCVVSSCTDGFRNQGETDIDCGGDSGCQPCAIGAACLSGQDCVGGTCSGEVCVETVAQVATGTSHTCILLNTGAVRCWGAGDGGKLGLGGLGFIGDNPRSLPRDAGVVDLGPELVEQVVVGQSHSCALLEGGSVRCWGGNAQGQLGLGPDGGGNNVGDDELPSDLPPVELGGPVLQLAAGWTHTCALVDLGNEEIAVRCWGRDDWEANANNNLPGGNGVLGLGDDAPGNIGLAQTPVDVDPVDFGNAAPVQALAAGPRHTCSLHTNGELRCWGAGLLGQLGYGNEDSLTAPLADPVPLPGPASQVVVGELHTCAQVEQGGEPVVMCWGSGGRGQLGLAKNTATLAAEPVDVGGTVVELAAGRLHTCARLETNEVRCWGDGTFGTLGIPELSGDELEYGDQIGETPSSLPPIDLGSAILALSAGQAYTCAVTDSGRLRCWGDGGAGKLGYGSLQNIGDDETPASLGDVPCLQPE